MNFAVVATAASIAVLGVAALAPAPAFAKDGPEVKVRHAVARMVVIVEDRTDVAVEIEGGTAGLPRPTVSRHGDEWRIDGELGRRSIRNCQSSASGPARRPGEGASVEVRGHGRVNVGVAPLIVVRTPREVQVSIEEDSAVFGSIGRGATDVSLGNVGCGDWTVANTAGRLEVSAAGSGDVWAGTSNGLEINVAGSGNVAAGATRSAEINLAGSGDITIARVDGSIEGNIAGSGDVLIRGGQVTTVEASIAGSGSLNVNARVASVTGNIVGSGDVRVQAAGSVQQNVLGSGRVLVGR